MNISPHHFQLQLISHLVYFCRCMNGYYYTFQVWGHEEQTCLVVHIKHVNM